MGVFCGFFLWGWGMFASFSVKRKTFFYIFYKFLSSFWGWVMFAINEFLIKRTQISEAMIAMNNILIKCMP